MHPRDVTIVVVNDFAYVNGGSAQVALVSAKALAAREYNVILFAAVGPASTDLHQPNLSTICLGQHEIVEDPNRLRAFVQGIWNLRASREMARLLRQLDPAATIIHIHGWTKALSASVVRQAVVRGFSVVCTLHDYFSACPNGAFFHYPKAEACHLRPLSFACIASACDKRNFAHKLWRVARQIVQQRMGRLPGGIHQFIVPSELCRGLLQKTLPPSSTTYLVRNPIDMPKREPVTVEANPAYIFLGRLAIEKGCLLLARAGHQVGCPVTFVGDGECRESIEKESPSAVITGWCDRLELIHALSNGRVLVAPSLCYETQGLAVVEAAALGIPAIVADTSAASESVVDGVTGLCFKGGDLEDLAAKMRLMRDDDTARRMGRAAYDRYWSSPEHLESHVDRLEEIYEMTRDRSKHGLQRGGEGIQLDSHGGSG
ncbi:MAG: glycosyl transferase group 1 [Nitrospira sp.]|jgi:glycosyltransferase involved in cell wall biosynthesis|nr:glycosyl transferase group 1 [Nitrospira sp.]